MNVYRERERERESFSLGASTEDKLHIYGGLATVIEIKSHLICIKQDTFAMLVPEHQTAAFEDTIFPILCGIYVPEPNFFPSIKFCCLCYQLIIKTI